ncbi:MAG: CinA family protein [Chloroflexota bacterium]
MGTPDFEATAAMAARLQAACLARGLTVATAESCTGGAVAQAITDVAGSSGYFRGSIVSYADETKTTLLGVDSEVMAAHGAVSAQVAVAMAVGARERFKTTVAVSITGIAGPSGGSASKPVGLTYLGLADETGGDVRRVHWTGDRSANRADSVRAALEWLLEWAEAHSA